MSELRDALQSALGASYTLEHELGGGGMARVFVAEESALGRKVVVKVLSPELLAGVNIDRFRREIQLAARLQQAQIVPVLSAGELDGVPYYTMPFIEGESLRAKLARVGPLPVAEVVSLLRDVTRALAYAHEHGVVHRDIKPDNVLLSGGSAVVTDFGIAKALASAKLDAPAADDSATSSLTMVGTSLGTPAYLSPEQAAGDPNVDHRSDLYSLGCMAYELLAGAPPFGGRTPQRMIVAHLTETPRPLGELRPDAPKALVDLVMRCLAKDPNARPQSAAEVGAALEGVTTNGSATAAAGAFARPVSATLGLSLYAAAFVIVALLAKAAVLVLGLPDWVFTGAAIVMLLGLPAVALAAFQTTRYVTWPRAARGVLVAIGGFVIAVAAIMGLRLLGIGPAASLLAAGTIHNREPLLVIDFAAGKDSSLSHVVTEAVRTNLGQSKVVSILTSAEIGSALQRMQRPADAPVDLELARDLAQREGVKAIVDGDVTRLGAGYVVSIRLVSADSGKQLAAYRASADGTAQLLDAIDQLTRKLRRRIGESLKSVRDAPPLDQVTTSSLDALRKYAEAMRAFDLQGDYARSATLLRQAVALDTTFAMAYRKLGVALSDAGMPRAQVDSALTRAYEFRNRLPEKEKYNTIATYYSTGPGADREKAGAAYEHVLALDSTDFTAAANFARNLAARRQYARADTLYARVLAAHPSQVVLGNYFSMSLTEGKVARADSLAAELVRQFPNAQTARIAPPMLMYVHGQADSAEAYWRARRNDPNITTRMTAAGNLANFAILHGRLREARDLARQMRALNAARGVPSSPLADSLLAADFDMLVYDKPAQGAHAIDAALAETPLASLPVEQRRRFTIATHYAWAGRVDQARAMLAQFDAEADPQYRRASAPSRHAALAQILIAEKHPLDAVREIRASDSLPDGPVGDCANCLDPELGRAFDAAGRADSAIFYYNRYINNSYSRSVGRDALLLPAIEERLGELYEAKGDAAQAEPEYQAFIALWKNADPELQPRVEEATKRLAALRAAEKR